MKKIKLVGFLVIILGLFFAQNRELLGAFTFETICQSPLTTFSNSSETFEISFPPGGGTTCSTIADCPKISLPANGTVFSVKVDMELTDPASEIGTPYIWAPTVNGFIEQVDTSDCSLVGIYTVGSSPSRTFVVPGGDVWVANRNSGNVTRLSPLTGDWPAGGTCGDGLCGLDENIYICPADCNGNVCGDGTGTCKNNVACGTGTENCEEYKVVNSYATGGGPRGVTGDINGNVWVGNYSSANVVKLNPTTGAVMNTIGVGGGPYGLVGDQYGHIWISNRGGGSLQCVNISNNSYTTPYVFSSGSAYGLGVDKDGNIYIANYGSGTVLGFNAITESNCPASMTPSKIFNTGTANGSRGVAVDQSGNVWVSNSGSNKFFVFTSPASSYSVSPGGSNILGAAVDADGYGWTVSYVNSTLYKYDFTGASLNLECSKGLGGNPYNYSDMTGLRTVPKNMSVSGLSIPLSPTGTFEVCTDGATTCSDAVPCAAITAFLSGCTSDAYGNCEIPLNIFSVNAGDYTLKNLEVIYGKQIPVTTGGLVPCGREWDDPNTSWDDTDSCEFCHGIMLLNQGMNFLMKIAGVVAVLALIITGFLFITSAGNPERKNNAKTTFKWVIVGFLILFLSWLLVDFFLSAWGYLDPLGGEWNVVCD